MHHASAHLKGVYVLFIWSHSEGGEVLKHICTKPGGSVAASCREIWGGGVHGIFCLPLATRPPAQAVETGRSWRGVGALTYTRSCSTKASCPQSLKPASRCLVR